MGKWGNGEACFAQKRIDDGRWHHVYIDGGGIGTTNNCYIDGTNTSWIAGNPSYPPNGRWFGSEACTAFSIGALQRTTLASLFVGFLTDFRFGTNTLTSTQITNLRDGKGLNDIRYPIDPSQQ